MITGRKPDLSKMNIFGSASYAYKNLKKKLDPKYEQGIFVEYDRNSPAYLVFYPEDNRVLQHCQIKFTRNSSFFKKILHITYWITPNLKMKATHIRQHHQNTKTTKHNTQP